MGALGLGAPSKFRVGDAVCARGRGDKRVLATSQKGAAWPGTPSSFILCAGPAQDCLAPDLHVVIAAGQVG